MTTIATSRIVSQAFRLLERSPISSLADDSREALDAAEQYPVALDHVLSRLDWSFASVRAELSPSTPDAPDPDLPFFFVLPGECLQLREVGPKGTKWRRDRDGLFADAPGPLPVRYTARLRDESKLPAMVQTTIAFRLAFLLGPLWITTASKVDGLEARYEHTLKQAAREDARSASGQRYDEMPLQPDWVEAARW